MTDFTVDLGEIEFTGDGFSRAECILYTECGDMFFAHMGAVARHVTADGRSKVIGTPPAGMDFIPNGIALLADGSLLVANMGDDGGIWQLDTAGDLRPWLMEADGRTLESANFVALDDFGRTWIAISTQTHPRYLAYNDSVADGYIVLVDEKGARIVAEGLAFTNECRVDASGKGFYVSETSGRRVKRYTIAPDGSLSHPDTFAEFGKGTFPDGIDFDSEGALWVTSIVSNRLYRIMPDGRQTIVVEDSNPDHIDWVEAAQQTNSLSRDHFYKRGGKKLNPITSVCFTGPDLRTVYLGSLSGESLATFRSPVAGRRPPHWKFTRSF
ncbi:SMP-30/gluconolactonase/LRE family protein [Oceanibacterium hippocampi]|uniref:SMP-30/Gluconolaconase/LRE-like region n=1 Tax=Oceanibacterium hippocampi TaxID=745714 RepID=A0A1Y5SJP1_9PROT|nr:SMP-30/gluconolactonase/LRE family protein [Oceanibacterium hippocampi]SLN42423.1 SMP-30/Gluconolaconase/LRE-like region [Oceanibacterium hippocampi]